MRKGTKTDPYLCYCLKMEFLMQEMDFYKNLMIHKLYESQFSKQKRMRNDLNSKLHMICI